MEIWFDWLPPNPVVKLGTQKGYSVFLFMVLYLIARAIRLHGLPQWFKKSSPFIYIVCSVVLALMAHAFVCSGRVGKVGLWFAYSNPLVILSSVAFLMMFEKLQIQSNLINYIAKSTLACLLGHTAIFFLYTKQFLYLYENYTGVVVMAYWALSVVIVFCVSIAIDQLRLLLYKPVEKLMKRTIKNNDLFPIQNK